jgi:predicted permease
MKWWQQLLVRFRSFFRKAEFDSQMNEEMRAHVEMQTQENIAAGMKPREARYAALREFGRLDNIKETCRDQRGVGWLENVLQDVFFGIRMLRKAPGFTVVVILSLALGVGATTAVYSVVNTVLLNPVPGPQPERLMQIAEQNYTQGLFGKDNNKPAFYGVSPPVLEALGADRDVFSDFAWFDSAGLEQRVGDFIESEGGAWVSPNFFSLLQARPLLGRTFVQDELTAVDENRQPVADSVIVISYSWWRSLFAGDPGVIGKRIELSGRHFTVIGVMPSRFQFPYGYTRFWVAAEPLKVRPNLMTLANTHVLVRLKSGVTEQQTQSMLRMVAWRLTQDYPTTKWGYGQEWGRRPHGLGFWIRPLRFQFQGGYGSEDLRRTLLGLMGAIGFVLLIVCANIGNLALARTQKRQQELGIRSALGASRARLMHQLLIENILLASAGGLLGLVVTHLAFKLLVLMIPDYMPRLKDVRVDVQALGFTLFFSVVSALVFGLAPAWRAGRAPLGEVLKQAGTTATMGVGRGLYRSGLVVTEVALALVLLTGAGLMIQSVVRLLHVNPGFDPQNLVYVNLQLPWKTYNDSRHESRASALRNVLYIQLHDRLAALPGVIVVGIGKHSAHPEKLKVQGQAALVELLRDGCGIGESDFFKAMHIPLREGRYFDRQDLGEGSGTAIINETMAQMCWPGESPIGKRFGGDSPYGICNFQIVGVVDDIRDQRYDAPGKPTFYRPCAELRLEGLAPFMVIRTLADPRSLVPPILKEMKAAEPAMEKPSIQIVREVLYDSTQAQRTYMLYLAVFAGVGLLLAAVGIYGVLAYSVSVRTREIGIRIAIGAQRRQVLGMVMGQGAQLVAAGTVVGLLAAFWLTRLLQRQLFQVSAQDPIVYAGVVLVLILVALLACLLPAIRATRVDPVTALRYE